MPDNTVHDLIARRILGRSFSKVNRSLDAPAKQLGPSHRRFYHDPFSAYLIGYAIAGERGGIAALLHLAIDRTVKTDSATALLLKILANRK